MRTLAAAAGVQLVGVRPEPGGAWVEVAWSSDNATVGADYVQSLIREGVARDLDVNRTGLNATLRNDRRVWIGRYFVLF
jgi:hypothetical protein